ncbi:hypothetical protein CBER1_03407 [Cercospora berteroae]|uniref:Uncharacterized protein n=1 Tax=Cercospora berteroae TaxID=357750 RepID=A0A2S6C8I4_9PEZI|nr:hypothetical protein CBER1_03407 [Cercospora berteroae]
MSFEGLGSFNPVLDLGREAGLLLTRRLKRLPRRTKSDDGKPCGNCSAQAHARSRSQSSADDVMIISRSAKARRILGLATAADEPIRREIFSYDRDSQCSRSCSECESGQSSSRVSEDSSQSSFVLSDDSEDEEEEVTKEDKSDADSESEKESEKVDLEKQCHVVKARHSHETCRWCQHESHQDNKRPKEVDDPKALVRAKVVTKLLCAIANSRDQNMFITPAALRPSLQVATPRRVHAYDYGTEKEALEKEQLRKRSVMSRIITSLDNLFDWYGSRQRLLRIDPCTVRLPAHFDVEASSVNMDDYVKDLEKRQTKAKRQLGWCHTIGFILFLAFVLVALALVISSNPVQRP